MNAHTVEMGCLIKWVEHDDRYSKVHSENCTASWREFELTAAVLELELREATGNLPVEMSLDILREFGVPALALHKSLLEAMGWPLLRYVDVKNPKFLPFREEFSRAVLEVTDSEYLAHKAIRALPRDEACELFASGPLARFFEEKRRNAWVRRQTVNTGCIAMDYVLPNRSEEYYELQEEAIEGRSRHVV